MRTIKSLTWSLGVAGALAVLPSQAVAQQGDMVKGASVYGSTCGRCHNARSPVERSDREWVVIINHMRLRANLTGQQVRDVQAFLIAMNGDSPSPTGSVGQGAAAALPQDREVAVSEAAADIAEGASLLSEKGCVGCHLVGGVGGQIGPTLDGIVARKGAAFVMSKLTDPTFNNAGSLMPNLRLTAKEIASLVAYLATLNE